MSNVVNAMSIDVEEYFQVSAFEHEISRQAWKKYPSRVEQNIQEILLLLDQANTKATFFTLGWIADQHPHLVKAIHSEGHEIASHGRDHTRVVDQSPDEFYTDIYETKNKLEEITGSEITGYRAASFSINSSNKDWAFQKIVQAGYKYSSSVYPVKHDLYGIPDAPRFKYQIEHLDLIEIPISTVKIFGRNFPCGGGGFFRLYPYHLTKWALRNINTKCKQPTIFYFHPWEIDPSQPRVKNVSIKSKMRHYINLSKTKHKLSCLLDDFSWDRVDQVYLK